MQKPHFNRIGSNTVDGVRTVTMTALVDLPEHYGASVRIWMEEVWVFPDGAVQHYLNGTLDEARGRYWFSDRDHGFSTLEVCMKEAQAAVDSGDLMVVLKDMGETPGLEDSPGVTDEENDAEPGATSEEVTEAEVNQATTIQ